MNNSLYKFEIQTNKAGQRVAIVTDEFMSRDHAEIAYDDFDAVLYKTKQPILLRFQLTTSLSVFTHNAFQFKPTFLPTMTEEEDLVRSFDGLADDINSQVLIDETHRIKLRMEKLGFKIFSREASHWTVDNLFYAFVRHSLTRGDRLPKLEIIKGSPFGYLHPIMYVMFQGLNISSKQFMAARGKLQGEYHFLDFEELVCVSHVCPECFDKTMIYHETCPKCSSVDISEHNMIHHFRCANISPEHTYMNGGRLVCPKCSRDLKHIGVDYDRPTTSYHCNQCSINFSEAKVICECENCLKKSPIESLVPIKLYNVIFNRHGFATLPVTDHFVDSDETARFPDVMSYNQFVNILKVRLRIITNLSAENHILRVYRTIFHDSEQLEAFAEMMVANIYRHLPHANIAIRKNVAYLISERIEAISEEELEQGRKEIFANLESLNVSLDYFEFDLQTSPEDFIAMI